MTGVRIRPAAPSDLSLLAALIRELAEYEKLLHEVRFKDGDLQHHLFGPQPAAEALIGEIDGEAQGFALFFPTFSSFEGKPGIWLEDLFVRPAARGRGLGKALLLAVAKLAAERGCGRYEWSVLDWNEPSIRFYRALGARPMTEWQIMRVDGEALKAMAGD